MTDDAARYRAIIAAAFPALALHSVRFLAAGWDSTAWLVNGGLVFRFPKRAEVATWLRYEIALLPQLSRALPVSVPRFAYIAEPSATFPYPFVGYHILPGVPLADAPSATIQPERLTAQIGAFLTALHRFPVAQAVACDIPSSSSTEWHRQYVTMLAELRALFARMTITQRERTERLFAGYLENSLYTRFVPALLHRDLGADHLLLDTATGDLTGVIDWGDLSIGDPAQDLCGLPATWLPALLTHYGGAVDAAFADRVAFYRALAPYHTLLFGLRTGNESFIAQGLAEIEKRAMSNEFCMWCADNGRTCE